MITRRQTSTFLLVLVKNQATMPNFYVKWNLHLCVAHPMQISLKASLEQGLQLMELVTPYMTEEQRDFSLPIRQIKEVEDAQVHFHASQGVECLFQLLDEDGDPIMVNLDDVSSWPTIAQCEDGSSVFGPAVGQGPRVKIGALKDSLACLGHIYRSVEEDNEDARKLAKLVQSQMANAAKDVKKGRELPELSKLLKDGGRSVDPIDKAVVIPDRYNSLYRKKRIAMVGEEAAVGEDQELSWMERLGNRRYCLRHNLPLIMAEVANMPEEQVISKLRAGTLKINDELIKKMDFAEEDEWFCKVCPAPAGSGGNTLLMTAPSSLLECPGCSSISVVPDGGCFMACAMCPITYGIGSVKRSELAIYKTPTEKEAQLTVYRQRFTYLKAYWGEAKLCSGLRYESSVEALIKSILEPANCKHPVYRYPGINIRRRAAIGSFSWEVCSQWMDTVDFMGEIFSRPSQKRSRRQC